VSSITISNTNWNTATANEVVITGVDDIVADGTVTYALMTGDPTSSDPAYDALSATNVADPVLNNYDNDVAAVTVTETSGSTAVTEGGATDAVSLVLTTQPTAPVTITLSGGTQVSLSTTSLTFTTVNWNVPQVVTVTAVDDSVVEGVHTQSVTLVPTSTDTLYSSLTLASVSVSITDNDAVSNDIDGDGILNVNDPDIDGDGINNVFDTDVDGDGTLNTTDTDDDSDGTPDGSDSTPQGIGTLADIDGDGIPNASDVDIDGDGVVNILDADTDNDGIPNTTDTDDDNDGTPDGSDSTPTGLGSLVDYDGDGLLNAADPDMDGDGVNNVFDTNPGSGVSADTDGDGITNGLDTDDDNDGILDVSDPSITGLGTLTDVDGDGTPDASDPDMDGDGILNAADSDTDGDGIPNATDTDDDNDGIPDGSDSTPTGYVTPVTSGGGGGGGGGGGFWSTFGKVEGSTTPATTSTPVVTPKVVTPAAETSTIQKNIPILRSIPFAYWRRRTKCTKRVYVICVYSLPAIVHWYW
jgi:hypothetical protein